MSNWSWTQSMRPFHLQRHADESGVSGEGRVAEGVVFTDGTVAMRWTPTIKVARSTVIYESIAAVELIHGHGGKTKVVFDKWEEVLFNVLEELGVTSDTVYGGRDILEAVRERIRHLEEYDRSQEGWIE